MVELETRKYVHVIARTHELSMLSNAELKNLSTLVNMSGKYSKTSHSDYLNITTNC